MQETGTRINKYMSQCGYCSRREADRLIEKGEVWINGTTMNTTFMIFFDSTKKWRYGNGSSYNNYSLPKRISSCISQACRYCVHDKQNR